jgi:hypothetical protein
MGDETTREANAMSKNASHIADDVAALEAEIEQALAKLNPRQRKYALLYSEGGITAEQALIDARYSKNTARKQNRALGANSGTARAIELLKRKHQLEHGISAAWKREKLRSIAERASTPGEHYNSHAANQAIRTLCEMDGDYAALTVKHQHLSVNVSLDYAIDLPGRVINPVTESLSADSDTEVADEYGDSLCPRVAAPVSVPVPRTNGSPRLGRGSRTD